VLISCGDDTCQPRPLMQVAVGVGVCVAVGV
jgi:hypothetical protein